MAGRRKSGVRSALLGALLLAAGVALCVLVGLQFRGAVLASQDAVLERLVTSVDHNLDAVLGTCDDELEYAMGRADFRAAEDAWREHDRTADLRRCMASSVAARNRVSGGMLAFRDGVCFLSTTESTDYLPLSGLNEHGVNLLVGPDDQVHLAFVASSAADDVQYALLLNLKALYAVAVGTELQEDENLFLMDAAGSLALGFQDGRPQVWFVALEQAAGARHELMDLLLVAQEQDAQRTGDFSIQGKSGDYLSRALAVPASACRNQAFAICVSTRVDESAAQLQSLSLALGGCATLALAGVVLLVLAVGRIVRRSREDSLRMEQLAQRAQAMQELADTTQQMAHHQRLETIGTLTAGIAHEFNNTLTPVMAYSLMALEQVDENDDALTEPLVKIYTASKQAKDLIGKLAVLSRGPSDGPARLSVDDGLDQALSLVEPSRPKTVTVERGPACGAWVMGDRTQVMQLWVNLFVNAFQAMAQDGGVLSVTAAVNDAAEASVPGADGAAAGVSAADGAAGAGSVTIRVADTGPGMPEEVRAQVFDPFFTTKPTGEGTGLGLAIVAQIVDNLGGSIEVDSQPGRGTTFTATLPLAQTTPPV
ncbi:MAG: ATP-binding protein [Coriobacteriia bacterium]|nr:ATP-binding protein [Coriobacteriia bacterium]